MERKDHLFPSNHQKTEDELVDYTRELLLTWKLKQDLERHLSPKEPENGEEA